MTKDSTVINNPPIKVTAQRGIDSKNPQSSIAVLILSGKTVGDAPLMPEADIILLISPCVIENRLISSSRPWVTAAFARAKRIKSFSACSGFFTSVKLPQVLTTPTTKNSTNSPRPIALTALWILTITSQIAPPLNSSGLWVIGCHISARLLLDKFCQGSLSNF